MGAQAFGSPTLSRFSNVIKRREKKALPFGFGMAGLNGGQFSGGGSVFSPGGGGGGGFTGGEIGGTSVGNPPQAPVNIGVGKVDVLNNPTNIVRFTPALGSQPPFPKQIGLGTSTNVASKSVLGKTPNQRAKKGKGGKTTLK